MPIKIAPSILSADFGAFAEAVEELTAAQADYIHIDVMDGHFVPNITFGAQLVRALRPVTAVPFDTHLMIERPEQYVAEFAKAGSNLVTIHPETTFHLNRLLHQIQDAGAKAGVALNPATPISAIEWVLGDLDRILVMTVNPGFGGQAFLPEMLQKIRSLAELRAAHGLRFEIGVDGGVNSDTAPLVARAGADTLIAGSAVFHHPEGLADAVAELRRLAADAAPPAAPPERGPLMAVRAALVLALLLAAGFGVWEVRRWSTPEGRELISPKQRLLRLWGLFFLLATLGLWLGGTYLPTPHPGDKRALIHWIQYWLLTVLASLPLIPLALLDWRENLRRLTASRKKLFQETLGSLHQSSADPPPTTPA